ncbi:type II restriction modification system, methylation subunit [hydrothermal vent metagenome]|uniref:site-specific DNA-methyltransferase (cytosine-N(4)-specific) n=1 Tax=hydrothermal vent metagenome TaxID=652676 RepID=A0A3B0VSS7_9ZZZZ
MKQIKNFDTSTKDSVLSQYSINGLSQIVASQKAIPSLAKNKQLVKQIENILPKLPTKHEFYLGDATNITFLKPKSIHLILTSPPYWILKKYNEHEGQLGAISDYDSFLLQLKKVWTTCFDALVPGGRLICVVGDVCLSRRRNKGRHTVVPLHAAIQEQCRLVGYDNLAPIIWYKIANANFEASRGSGFLGKPYEPNAVIKNDIEYILMERKPGGYRSPSFTERIYSVISEENHKKWFNQIWTGLNGASTRNHPAPYPIELATRLIRMFSFVGDTVLDPFNGTGTTSIASAQTGRNSIGVEVDESYLNYAASRFKRENRKYFMNYEISVNK